MTQTRKEALTELLAKAEAGGEGRPNFCDLVSRPLMQCRAGEAYHGSLDAAKVLHEAVLPGWSWEVTSDPESGTDIWLRYDYDDEEGDHFLEYGGWGLECTPARAWLIAILKALIAQEPGQ